MLQFHLGFGHAVDRTFVFIDVMRICPRNMSEFYYTYIVLVTYETVTYERVLLHYLSGKQRTSLLLPSCSQSTDETYTQCHI